jgi:hypothetical protein
MFTSISGVLAPMWKTFKWKGKKKKSLSAACAHCRAESFFSVWSTFNRTVPSWIKPSRDDHRRRYLRLLPGIFGNLAHATGEVTTWERLRYLQLPRGPDCLTTAPPGTWKLRFQCQTKGEKPWTSLHILNEHFTAWSVCNYPVTVTWNKSSCLIYCLLHMHVGRP